MSFKKSAIKKNQEGRTLLEILAVLAIIGALTAGGLILYSRAGSKRNANLIYEDILVQSEHIRHRGKATGKSIFDSAVGNKTRSGLMMSSIINTNSFSITVHDISKEDCADLSQKDWPTDRISKIKIDNIEYPPNEFICPTNHNFDLTAIFLTGNNKDDDENKEEIQDPCANECLDCQRCQQGECIDTCEPGEECLPTPASPKGECYIDPCAGINCGEHGHCSNGSCICNDGWSGNGCNIPTICECSIYGTCINNVCICQDGWEGERCDIDEQCAGIDCGEHGKCIEGTCVCSDDYFGEHCENAPLQCTNYGTWNPETSTCICSNNWRGERCERPPYTGNDVGSCDNGNAYLSYMTDPCGVESPTPELMLCSKNSDCDNGYYCHLDSNESGTNSAPNKGECKTLTSGKDIKSYDKSYIEFKVGPSLSWWSAQNWCNAHKLEQPDLAYLGLKQEPRYCTGTNCKGVNFADLKKRLGSGWFWASNSRTKDTEVAYGIQTSTKMIDELWHNGNAITLCVYPKNTESAMQCRLNSDCENGYFCNLTSSESHSEPDASVCEPLTSGQQADSYLKGPALTWWGAQNWCEAHDMELTSLFSLGLTSTPANCTGTNCKGINWTKVKNLLGSNWFWTSDVRSASASYGIQTSEKKINSKYLSNTYLITLCGTKPIYTNDDIGICENGNVYLSYMTDPCATETPQDMQCRKNSDCENGYFCNLTSSDSALKPDAGVCNKLISGQKLGSYLKGPQLTWWGAQNWCKAHGMNLTSLSELGMTISAKDCTKTACTGINWTNLKNQLGSYWFWTSSNRDGNVAYGIQPSYQQVDGQYHNGSIYTLCSSG